MNETEATDRTAPDADTGRPTATPGQANVRKILLATDLSRTSAPATNEAFETASRLRAELLIVSVIDTGSLRLPGGRFHARVDQVRERRQAAAQELIRRGRRERVPVAFLVWEGDPGESILEAADAEGADMIIMGSHGRGAIGRRLLGSVSQHVVRHAAVPVVVIPDGGFADGAGPRGAIP